jgi:RHS repeat-associated protein
LYYCQNWRHDVVALVTAAGALKERVRYSSYGVPFGIPLGDCDSDGDVDSADTAILLGAWGTSTAKCDLDLNGTIDATDQSMLLGNSGATGGAGSLTRSWNRFGYAGYAGDCQDKTNLHVRHRVLASRLGHWLRRDPSGNADGTGNLLAYVADRPSATQDPSGLIAVAGLIRSIGGLVNCVAGGFACGDCHFWMLTEEQNGLGWLGSLPDCPCSLALDPLYPHAPIVPMPWQPDLGTWDNDVFDSDAYHPGAKWCIRQTVSGSGCQPGQQCCYDSQGKLIKTGPGAGTPDKYAPEFGCLTRHCSGDVNTWKMCVRENALFMYHAVRPPNQGIGGCPGI